MPIFNKISHLSNKLTQLLIRCLQKNIPPISDSEREAIEAGDAWWEKDLFCGRPSWQKLLAMPVPRLSVEEEAFLSHQVEILCNITTDWEIIHHDQDLPKKAWEYLKHERFFGLIIPKEYGGRGFSALAHSTIVTKIATRSLSMAINMMVPNSLGPAELLLNYGTSEQKQYYLPRLASGREIPCFALTGPEAGSDAGSMTDSGVVSYGYYNGKKVLGIRLTWDKRYITLAPIATVLGVAFQLYDPDHLLGDKEDIGITLCLIPASHPGVVIGHRHYPLRLAFMNGPTRGEDVFVPMDWIIGGVEKAGQGWQMLMECLSVGRAISLPALSGACGKLSYRLTGAYARLRRQFNVPIAQFEGVEEALAGIAGLSYLLEASRLFTASAVDQGVRPAIASAIAKYHLTEMARTVMDYAMDVHGGHGIQAGPRNLLSNAYTAIPIGITVEGANILTRNLIIFGQGALRCHPYLLQEMKALSKQGNTENNSELGHLLLAHAFYMFRNGMAAFWHGLTGGHFIAVPVQGKVAPYYRQLTRMSYVLALLSDVCLLILGGKLKRKERTSARLGDILSYLYLASAVLKYFHDQGEPASDVHYVKWCIQYCLSCIQKASDELLHNFPAPWLGKLLRWMIFPWGTAYRAPKDSLSHRIVATMLEPGSVRDRLTRYCYVSSDVEDPLRRIENAFANIQEIEPVWKKFQNALREGSLHLYDNLTRQLQTAVEKNILTEEERKKLHEFLVLYQEIIRVNEFSFDLRKIVA
jgi:alkylation response protein AidB-like acyl-CoA dehydrogenase